MGTAEKLLSDPKGMKPIVYGCFHLTKLQDPYKLVNGPLTPQYNNDATLFEDNDGRLNLTAVETDFLQAKIDLSQVSLLETFKKFH